MMMCHTNGGIIVLQGCNSMQKNFENIGKVGYRDADFYDFYVPWKIFMCFVVFSGN